MRFMSMYIDLGGNFVQVDSDAVSGDRGKSGRSMGREDRGTVMGDSEVSGAGQ